MSRKRPKIVCLCGSTRFKEQFMMAQLKKTLAGEIVLTVGAFTHSDPELIESGIINPMTKAILDELHKRKIDMADYIYVLNVDGYVGESTFGEIEYAKSHGKPIEYLEPESVRSN